MFGGAFVEAPEGVFITAGYWGLTITLIVAGIGSIVIARYARQARRSGAPVRIPANTLFESEDARENTIATLSLAAFASVVFLATLAFAVRYSESEIHCWEAWSPIASGFWASRAAADVNKCRPQERQLAMASRFDNAGKEVAGVWQYIPFLTDGVLLCFGIFALAGAASAVRELRKPARTTLMRFSFRFESL